MHFGLVTRWVLGSLGTPFFVPFVGGSAFDGQTKKLRLWGASFRFRFRRLFETNFVVEVPEPQAFHLEDGQREIYFKKKKKKIYIYIYIYISVCVMKMFGVEHMFVKTFDMSGTKTCSAEQWVFSSVCEAHHKSWELWICFLRLEAVV